MARPTKHANEKRSQRFNLRFTVAELDDVETQARIAGLGPHEYLRRRVLGYEVPSQEVRKSSAALVKEINDLGLELNAIGVNANQLALAANSERRAHAAWEDVVARINELGDQVSSALERLVLGDP